MSQTEETKTNPEPTTAQVERVRKVFVRDLSLQQKVHTVFRVSKKSLHQARSGKPFLALVLVDKTGEIPGRIFDNVESANAAFEENDYLLVKGTVIHFRNKLQLLVEQLERLAPEPMDAAEFIPPPPPPTPEKPAPAPKNKPPKTPKPKNLGPAAAGISQALDLLRSALETFVHEKIEQRLAELLPTTAPPAHKTLALSQANSAPPKTEAKTEAPSRGLPKEFSFKPFDLLTAEEGAPAPQPEPASSAPSDAPSETPES